MKPFNITTNGITKLLKNLNPYKAQGPDNLSPRILKELGNSYVVLTFVFYVCPEFFHSRVWFFLLWCYDISIYFQYDYRVIF
jgi:hypothetical protein